MREINRQALEGGQERILKYVLSGIREHSLVSDKPERLAEEIHCFLIGQSIKYLSQKKETFAEIDRSGCH